LPNYRYKARDKYGKSSSGMITGKDEASIAKHLGSMGYIPTSIEEADASVMAVPFLKKLFDKVTIDDVSVFTRQLLTLQESGISMLSSLNIIEKQTKKPHFKDILKEVAAAVEGGLSLSEALSKHPKVFNDLYIGMIRAGEASGLLDQVLDKMSVFLEKEMRNRNKIQSATRYPLITLCALAAAFVVVVNFVIPKFAVIFAQFKGDLPLPTKMLLNMSYAMKHFWLVIMIIVIGSVWLFLRYINTKNGRLRWDAFQLKAPIFGPLITMLAMEKFSRTMSILLTSGLPILQVFEMVSNAVGNAEISRIVNAISTNVRDGKRISEPMEMSGLFPPIVVQMVSVGEDTGKLDTLLMKVSEYYEQQSDYLIENFTTLIEPLIITILGGMVLIMALAIFLPMWNMLSLMRH